MHVCIFLKAFIEVNYIYHSMIATLNMKGWKLIELGL